MARAPIRLLLVDDHAVMRVGLASMLKTIHGFDVVAEADDGAAAVALYGRHRPDVVLLDVSMDKLDGIDTLRLLRRDDPMARVIMLSSSKAAEDAALSIEAGACGYLVKTVHHQVLADAIRTVHTGGRLGPPSTAESGSGTGPLSHRETEVLGLVRQGFSNDEIASLLGISPRTARAHVSAILAALGAADRAQAVAIGFELGILRTNTRRER